MNIYRNSGKYGPDGMSLSGSFVKTWFNELCLTGSLLAEPMLLFKQYMF